jgi:hypothetical protein
MEYKIVYHYRIRDAEAEVNRLLADGWILAGGVYGNSRSGWSQAMVRGFGKSISSAALDIALPSSPDAYRR